jgi:hypothetical protein
LTKIYRFTALALVLAFMAIMGPTVASADAPGNGDGGNSATALQLAALAQELNGQGIGAAARARAVSLQSTLPAECGAVNNCTTVGIDPGDEGVGGFVFYAPPPPIGEPTVFDLWNLDLVKFQPQPCALQTVTPDGFIVGVSCAISPSSDPIVLAGIVPNYDHPDAIIAVEIRDRNGVDITSDADIVHYLP